MARKDHVLLPAIHPNVGITRQFQRELDALIDEMHHSLVYWLSAAWRANTPETVSNVRHNEPKLAHDASIASILNVIMVRLTKRWTKKFNEVAAPLAAYYAQAAKDRTDAALKAALKKSGMTVEFKVTPAIQDIITASVNYNVKEVKDIPYEHLTDVSGILNRGIQQGRDLGGIVTDLNKRLGITKRKARLMAHMSNNQASAMIEKQRAKELGIEEAQWVHSNAGKHPRHEHVEWHGTMYNIHTGKWSSVSKKYVWPGTDFNCRCTFRMKIKTNILISESTKQRAR